MTHPHRRAAAIREYDAALLGEAPAPARPDGRWTAEIKRQQDAARAWTDGEHFESVPLAFIEQDEWTVPFA